MAGFGDEAHGSESPSRTKRMSESNFNFNVATAVFATFSALSFVVCLARGLVPIYLVESVLWAAAAWYWNKKKITNSKANLVVLWLAIAIAAGESYRIGHKVGLGEVSRPARNLSDLGFRPVEPIPSMPPPQAPTPTAASHATDVSAAKVRPAKPPGPACPSGIPAGAKQILLDATGSADGMLTISDEIRRSVHFEGDDHLLVVTNTTSLNCITAVQVLLRSRTNKEEWQRLDITFIHPLAPGKRVEHSFPVSTSALSRGLYSEFPAVDFEFTEVWAIPKNEP
jgi:hypothetical protein